MELATEKIEMLNLMLRPAFWVKDGIIRHINPAAAFLQLSEGQRVTALISSEQEEYAQFFEGCLHLALCIGERNTGVMVTHLDGGHLFLPDMQSTPSQFQTLSLAAMQLREPLAGLMAITEQAIPEEKSEYAAMANRRIHQLLRIIGNMSDVQRFHDPAACRMEYTEICGFLEELLDKADSLLSHIGIRIASQIPKESIYTLLDREQLERAVYNMLSNAAKYGRAGESVQVQLTHRGSKLYLSVLSSGESRSQSSFYDRFLREPSLEEAGHGIGLGMVLIRSAAVNHGGALLIDRPTEDSTRITMSLAIHHGKGDLVRSPIMRIDYAGEQDHGLLELSDVLPAELYATE